MHPYISDYIESQPQHKETLLTLRSLILSSGLKETFKCLVPYYTFQGKNVLSIQYQKKFCVINFHLGEQFKNKQGLVFKKHQSLYYFEKSDDILAQKDDILGFIIESIQLIRKL